MRNEDVVPMHPWYRGFRGTHEWMPNKNAYLVRGKWHRVDDTTFEITELPVSKWTQTMKVISSFFCQSSSCLIQVFLEQSLEGETPLISDYKDYNTVTRVHFIVSCPDLAKMSDEEVEKKFGLVTTIKKTNMHFFDQQDRIHKYGEPEEILKEFYNVRLEYYEKRKAHLVKQLEEELLVLKDKARFVLMVIKGELLLGNKPKKQLLDELQAKKFRLVERRAAASQTEDGEEEPEGDLERGYDYLLSIKLWGLTKEFVDRLHVRQPLPALRLTPCSAKSKPKKTNSKSSCAAPSTSCGRRT